MKTERELFEAWYHSEFDKENHENSLVWNHGGYIDHNVNLLYKGWIASTNADRWVSVDDEMPKGWEDVLVVMSDGEVLVDYFIEWEQCFKQTNDFESAVKFWMYFKKPPSIEISQS